jgi:phenylacetate-CoA ligase
MLAENGASVGVLDTIFDVDMPIREAQIIQESLRSIRIKVVPGLGFGDKHRQSLARGIRMRMGSNVEVPIEAVDSIPRTKAGKFRVQVCMLNGDPGGSR